MEEPLARYPVRTPGWVWPVIVLTGVAAAVLGWPVLELRGSPLAVQLGLFALLALLPVLAFFVSAPYRVGARTIDLYADRLAIPRAWSGLLVIPLRSLRVERLHVVQDLTVMHVPTGVQLDRGERVTFRDGAGGSRDLSDRVFEEPASLQLLLFDVSLVSKGQPPRGPAGWASLFEQVDAAFKSLQPVDPLDARLDEELRRDD